MSTCTLEVDGQVFRDWTSVQIQRSLHELSGSFRLEYDDQVRMQGALPRSEERFALVAVRELMPVKLYLDGELVMRGWVDDVDWEITGDQVRASLTGFDPGGDLMACSANPQGPAEYKGMTVLQIAQALCKPFGVPVTAECDVGAPLPDFGIDVGESVISVLDKAAKQRAVLVTSNGVGGIVLTTSGTRRAPDALTLPGNVLSLGGKRSAKERYSDYWVKGQARGAGRGRRGQAPLDGTAMPLAARPAPGSTQAAQARGAGRQVGPLDGTAYPLGTVQPRPASRSRAGTPQLLGVGHAVDPAVGRYRPRVWVARSQSGGSPNQVLADWRLRIARARAHHDRYAVQGWRSGPAEGEGKLPRLWRPNEVVQVRLGTGDPYDMLVEGVAYTQDDHAGSRTQLTVVGREAYDLVALPDEHRRGGAARGSSISRGAPGQPRRGGV